MRQWTPFADSGYYVVWTDGLAMAFCWDAGRVGQAIADQGLKPARVRVIPETVLRPAADAGARLLACLQGYEGQIWAGSQLAQSRWWQEVPAIEDWLAFQRDAACPPEEQQASVPSPLELAFAEQAWGRAEGGYGFLVENWKDEKLAYFALALLLLPPTAWQAARLHNYRVAIEQLQAEYAALRQEAGPVAEARGQALQALARVQRLQALDPYPPQLELMAWVAEKLARPGDRLTEWSYQDGRLKFTLAASEDIQSSSAMVNTLQLSGLFDNVRSVASKSPKSISFEMDLLPLNPAPQDGHV